MPIKDSDGTMKGCLATLRHDKPSPVLQHDGASEISPYISISDSLIENFPTPFFTVDQNLVITRMNKPLEVLSGYGRNEVIGRMKCSELLSTAQCKTPECLLKRSMEKKTAIAGVKKKFKNRRGEEITILINASIITDQSGHVLGGFEAFQDISELERAQDEIEKTRRRLFQTEKFGAIGRFAAGFAHEINNPITGILNYCDLVIKEIGDDPQLLKDMNEIIAQALYCKDVVNNLTTLSQKSLIIEGLVDIKEMLDVCMQQHCARYALSKDIKLTWNLQEELPKIRGSRKLLVQIINNLVANAIDSLAGQGSVRVSAKFYPDLQKVVIEVEDTGCGIPDEEKTLVFEHFYTTKPPGKGSGLGLSIVHEIVTRHSGSVEIKDVLSGGTIFTVHLPLESSAVG